MDLLFTIMLAHLLADFPLQSNSLAASKTKSLKSLLNHIVIHAGVLWALLGLKSGALPIVLGVSGSHLIVDWLKPRLFHKSAVRAFIIDQSAHFICILGIGILALLLYPEYPTVVVSRILLYPSFLVSLGFAFMVLYWTWTTSLSRETVEQSAHLRWSRDRLLEIEQRAGLGLIFLIGIGSFLIY